MNDGNPSQNQVTSYSHQLSCPQVRRAGDVMLLTNSTLVVQIFFLMASFLLAHKVLRESARGAPPPLSSFFSTMLHRIIR